MPVSVAELTSYAARHHGRREAVRFAGAPAFSYGDIHELAARCAGGLRALGVAPGDRVILHLPNSWEWIVAYHALAMLAAVCIPANILLTGEELTYIAGHSGAKFAILPAERAGTLPSGVRTIATGDAAAGFASLLFHDPLTAVPCGPDDLFSICYTSGTTGRPKGAMLSHGNLIGSIAMTATIHVRTAQDRVYSALPFPHVYGNVVLNAGFLTGSYLAAAARFDAGEALHAIAQDRMTLFEGVPTM